MSLKKNMESERKGQLEFSFISEMGEREKKVKWEKEKPYFFVGTGIYLGVTIDILGYGFLKVMERTNNLPVWIEKFNEYVNTFPGFPFA